METRHLTDSDKREICAWKYPGEYRIYNLPDYDEMAEKNTGFMDPNRYLNYYGFFDNEVLIGFSNIREASDGVIIGIGVHPKYCGKHYGQKILTEACCISKKLYPGKPLLLDVRTWNARAIKCYQNAGFHIDGAPYELKTPVGAGLFYRMVKD